MIKTKQCLEQVGGRRKSGADGNLFLLYAAGEEFISSLSHQVLDLPAGLHGYSSPLQMNEADPHREWCHI